MSKQILLSPEQLQVTINRLAHQVVENYGSLENIVFIGIQPRGAKISEQIVEAVRQVCPGEKIQYGLLDITFYRDDVREEFHVASETNISFSVENKIVVLIDDVLYTGRTIRAALDALQDFGRPQKVELCVLINRRFSRQLPIQPDYCGKAVDSTPVQKVKVEWENRQVLMY
ncbi:MAG: bifunctional pyr operon transcriptional regulator/uracil phosphoribosyltransferase PyrR [Chitinophagaceae bacterium]|nr:MAG: bifunctional pyr operon transcriptional regulator/uracil phosphoribosyltransferase PyrR [Chitinophagaceae bacterium]